MQNLSWKLVKKFDALCDSDGIRGFLLTVKLSDFFNQDNTQEILGFAEKLGVKPQELGMYIWLQVYIRELSESFEDTLLKEVVAQYVGLRCNRRFRQYIDRRAESMRLSLHAIIGD